jgi:single-strand DNA-binding protein
MYLNKALIIGNLTQDPELRSTPSGSSVTSFTVATNRVWNDNTGQRQEETEFHNLVAFGKQAEIITQYLRKGSLIYIEGRLRTRSWEAPDGQKRYKTEIVIDNFQMGPKGTSSGGGNFGETKSPSYTNNSPRPSANTNATAESLPTVNLDDDQEIDLEEIPF